MFVRTKNGVYEVKENMTIENGVYSFFGKIYNTTEKHLFRNDKDLGEVVKQADTIEELCDEFIHKENTKLPHIFVPRGHWTYEECKEWCFNEYSSKNDYELYGAIWTGKGLIYVAKMNENGELELI